MHAQSTDGHTQPLTINELLSRAAADAQGDPRTVARFPFFRGVTIEENGRSHSAFTRDLSTESIGLLHNVPIPLGEVDVILPIATDKKCKIRVCIERCEPLNKDWFISGGRFIGITPAAELDDELLEALLAGRA